MGEYPRESRFPSHPEKPDDYVKPFLSWAGEPLPGKLRCFNKTGRAYGYLIDCAYIVDFEKDLEFILGAVIHANANQVYNDNQYEYDTVSLPFFHALGKAVYEWEARRERQRRPNLSAFQFDWEKGDD